MPNFDGEDYALGTFTDYPIGQTWRPIRAIGDLNAISLRNRLKSLEPTSSGSGATLAVPIPPGTPGQLLSVQATQGPFKSAGKLYSQVSVTFIVDPADTAFAGVHIWFTGYHGSTAPQLMVDGNTSPTTFNVDATGETVVVTVQPFGANGTAADFATALTCTVTLSGQVSNPPPPTVGSLVSTPTGVQFSFTQLGGLLQDVISSYKVYHNNTNNSSTATVYQVFPQDPSNAGGTVVVQETLANGTLEYYWVTSVNTSGLESTKAAATGNGTIISGLATSSDNMIRNGDFSGGNANWSQIPASSIFTGVSGLPVGTSEFKWLSSQGVPQFFETDDYIPIDTTKQYYMSAWAKFGNTSNGTMYLGLHEYDSNKNAINHEASGAFAMFCLLTGQTRTSGGQFSEPSTNGWQYFSNLIAGPAVAPANNPNQVTFASGTAYVRPIIIASDTGSGQQLEICNIRLSVVEAVSIAAYKKANGVNLIPNSEFRGGIGGSGPWGGYLVYDNNLTGNVTLTYEPGFGAPNSTGNRMRITTASGVAPSPGLGGFTVNMGPDSGTLTIGQYHKGDRILVRMYAYIPVGATVHYASNAYGDQGTFQWITSNAGNSLWTEYLALLTIGTTGTFSTIGYFWIDNNVSTPFTWWVGSFEMIDLEQVQLTNSGYQLWRQGVSTSLTTQGSIIPTQSFTITYSSTGVTISLSWSAQTLYRADGSTFTVASGTQNYSGLSTSTSYYIYPYIDVINNVVGFANANPPGTSSSSTLATQTQFDNRSGLTPIVVTTAATSGGTGGGGSGGGGPTCPEQNELVEVLRNGKVQQIKVGDVNAKTDLLKGFSFKENKDVYRKLLSKHPQSCAAWYMVDGHRVSPCEPIYKNGQWIPAFKAPGATFDTLVSVKIDIIVDVDENDEHNYWLVGDTTPLLIHNWIPYC